jgi:hypothetical protein
MHFWTGSADLTEADFGDHAFEVGARAARDPSQSRQGRGAGAVRCHQADGVGVRHAGQPARPRSRMAGLSGTSGLASVGADEASREGSSMIRPRESECWPRNAEM